MFSKIMNIDLFIKEADYEVGILLDDETSCRVIMDNNETHDIWFIIKDKITKYEAYNQLDDSSIFLSDEELEKLENWFKTLKL